MKVKTITTEHSKTRRRLAEGVVNCCCHEVDFWYEVGGALLTDDDLRRMESEAEDRATEMIAEGFASGELCCLTFTPVRHQERELHGSWSISH